MKGKSFAKSNDEFDRRFDAGEDIHELVDITQATVTRPGRKVRNELVPGLKKIGRCPYLFRL